MEKAKTGILMLLGIVVGLTARTGSVTTCYADEIKAEKGQAKESLFEFDDGWWRVCEGKREARITQCAFYVSMFAMNYLDVPCDPLLVSESLPPSSHGVSLDKIQRVLQAHGLNAEGRKGVHLEDLLHLPDGACAILALPIPSGGDHFFAIASGESGVYCADVPRQAVVLDKIDEESRSDIEKKLAARQGMVLLVRRRSEDTSLSESIRISPERSDLGEFLVAPTSSSVKAVRTEIRFTNTSSRPIAVAVKTSCGCVGKMTWKNRIVDAGDTERLTIEILPSAWGVRKRAEDILVVFPDASKKVVSLLGTGHAGQGTRSLHLTSSKEVRVQIADRDARTYEGTIEAGVFASPDIASKLEIESNVAWIQPVIEAVKPGAANIGLQQKSHRVLCTVHGSEKVLDELCGHNNSILGLVTVTAKSGGQQVQISVILSRNPLLCVEPNIVSIADKEVSKAIRNTRDERFSFSSFQIDRNRKS